MAWPNIISQTVSCRRQGVSKFKRLPPAGSMIDLKVKRHTLQAAGVNHLLKVFCSRRHEVIFPKILLKICCWIKLYFVALWCFSDYGLREPQASGGFQDYGLRVTSGLSWDIEALEMSYYSSQKSAFE